MDSNGAAECRTGRFCRWMRLHDVNIHHLPSIPSSPLSPPPSLPPPHLFLLMIHSFMSLVSRFSIVEVPEHCHVLLFTLNTTWKICTWLWAVKEWPRAFVYFHLAKSKFKFEFDASYCLGAVKMRPRAFVYFEHNSKNLQLATDWETVKTWPRAFVDIWAPCVTANEIHAKTLPRAFVFHDVISILIHFDQVRVSCQNRGVGPGSIWVSRMWLSTPHRSTWRAPVSKEPAITTSSTTGNFLFLPPQLSETLRHWKSNGPTIKTMPRAFVYVSIVD